MVNGLWGEHEWMLYPQLYHYEFPYLTWLQLPSTNATSDILTSAVHKSMWQAHPNKSNIHSVNLGVFSKFTDKLKEVKAAMMNPFHKVSNNTCFSYL